MGLDGVTDENDRAVLPLIDGVQVVVPDSLDVITSYVLREQLDFFEDELRFVRQLLQPGQKAVDIGANFGVYTLSMAKKVGPAGHVWAFEPATCTAQFLQEGIAANRFTQVTLAQAALSSVAGTARLALQVQPELNSLIRADQTATANEAVSLTTLDECMDRYRWTKIDLIKIDAEGEERNIIRGGQRLFAQLSPIVQYELRNGSQPADLQLIQEFAALGYQSYRLVPGLHILVPVHPGSPLDPYLLNLFCCKPDRADNLAARNLLLRSSDLAGSNVPVGVDDRYHWRSALAHLPYVATLTSTWEGIEAGEDSTDLLRALASYALSRDHAVSSAQRFRSLTASYLSLMNLCAREPARLRLASLARVAHDFGARAISVDALKSLFAKIRQEGVDTGEPFLSPLERFESIAPKPEAVHWLVAAALEALEHREWFSSFYSGPSALERLKDIQSLRYGCPEMARRLHLVQQRYHRERARVEPPPKPCTVEARR